MNIKKIKDKIKNTSDLINKNDTNRLQEDNQVLQDFVLWLVGYLDGTEDQLDEIKKIREKMESLNTK